MPSSREPPSASGVPVREDVLVAAAVAELRRVMFETSLYDEIRRRVEERLANFRFEADSPRPERILTMQSLTITTNDIDWPSPPCTRTGTTTWRSNLLKGLLSYSYKTLPCSGWGSFTPLARSRTGRLALFFWASEVWGLARARRR